MKTLTIDQLEQELCEQDAEDWLELVTICPRCKTAQTGKDLIEAGAGKNLDDVQGFLGFSCVGRWDESKGCNWTLGGFFQIHETEIELEDGGKRRFFEIATKEQAREYRIKKYGYN